MKKCECYYQEKEEDATPIVVGKHGAKRIVRCFLIVWSYMNWSVDYNGVGRGENECFNDVGPREGNFSQNQN